MQPYIILWWTIIWGVELNIWKTGYPFYYIMWIILNIVSEKFFFSIVYYTYTLGMPIYCISMFRVSSGTKSYISIIIDIKLIYAIYYRKFRTTDRRGVYSQNRCSCFDKKKKTCNSLEVILGWQKCMNQPNYFVYCRHKTLSFDLLLGIGLPYKKPIF